MSQAELFKLLIDRQDTQDAKLDALLSAQAAGFARIDESLKDYPTIKAQVFKWRDSIGALKTVAGWVGGVASFGAAVFAFIRKFF